MNANMSTSSSDASNQVLRIIPIEQAMENIAANNQTDDQQDGFQFHVKDVDRLIQSLSKDKGQKETDKAIKGYLDELRGKLKIPNFDKARSLPNIIFSLIVSKCDWLMEDEPPGYVSINHHHHHFILIISNILLQISKG